MKTLCAWCKKTIKPEDGTGGLDSHGICEDCEKKEAHHPNATQIRNMCEYEAKKRLEDAAPDLLAACKSMLEDIEDDLADCDSPGTRQTLETQRSFLKAAIAKAKGDQP